MSTPAETTFRAWSAGDILLEHYHFSAGRGPALAPHAHEAVQLCLNEGSGGQYDYRGGRYAFAPGSLTVVNSGEAYRPGQGLDFAVPTAFRMLYLAPQALHTLAAELKGRPVAEPFFADLVLAPAPPTRALLRHAHQALAAGPADLATGAALLALQVALLTHHAAGQGAPRPVAADHPALRRVRDYLHAHVAEPPNLAELAGVACLSEYHLCMLFARRYGVAPHQYQIQLRLDRAKALLLAGRPIDRVAKAVGFFDGSHLVRHFRRVVGFTPSRYR